MGWNKWAEMNGPKLSGPSCTGPKFSGTLTETTVKFQTISIKIDRENEGYVTKTDFVR